MLPSDRGMGRVEHLRTFSSDLESWDSREREKKSDALELGWVFCWNDGKSLGWKNHEKNTLPKTNIGPKNGGFQ